MEFIDWKIAPKAKVPCKNIFCKTLGSTQIHRQGKDKSQRFIPVNFLDILLYYEYDLFVIFLVEEFVFVTSFGHQFLSSREVFSPVCSK